eukprot:6195460-Pleurochrysis_carterae.AAC.1
MQSQRHVGIADFGEAAPRTRKNVSAYAVTAAGDAPTVAVAFVTRACSKRSPPADHSARSCCAAALAAACSAGTACAGGGGGGGARLPPRDAAGFAAVCCSATSANPKSESSNSSIVSGLHACAADLSALASSKAVVMAVLLVSAGPTLIAAEAQLPLLSVRALLWSPLTGASPCTSLKRSMRSLAFAEVLALRTRATKRVSAELAWRSESTSSQAFASSASSTASSTSPDSSIIVST